jgi:8-oxo-dGTP diphosphatase
MTQREQGRPLTVVAAAALVRNDGRLLLQQRPHGKPMAGLWELPGGKIEPGESPEEALVREVEEELGLLLDTAAIEPFAFASHAYEGFHLLMPVFLCRSWAGTVKAREGQAIAWAAPEELSGYPAPAADIPLFRRFVEWSGEGRR